jgi:hypothetical protein
LCIPHLLPSASRAETFSHSFNTFSLRLPHVHYLISFRFYAGTRFGRCVKMITSRNHDDSGHAYVNPTVELNAGLWTLFAGASIFLALRIWTKITRRHGIWWDDYILLISWVSIPSIEQSKRSR